MTDAEDDEANLAIDDFEHGLTDSPDQTRRKRAQADKPKATVATAPKPTM